MQRIFYPYNENLPNHRAHDVYVVHNCTSLANAGWEVDLAVGKETPQGVEAHYNVEPGDHFHLHRFPITRKSPWLNISWNVPFFRAAQKWIKRKKPDLVIISVLKQGEYHHARRVPGVRYIFEVHELDGSERERKMLEGVDLVVTTTPGLAHRLRGLATDVVVIPLAVHPKPLGAREKSEKTIVAYVGQVYPLQGVDELIEGLRFDSQTHLKVIGGPPNDAAHLKDYAKAIGVADQVTLYGFRPPSEIAELLSDVDAFAMPARKILTLPDIAHTKLLEYATWGRPIIAPQHPVVRDHLTADLGVLYYEAGNPHSLANCFAHLRDKTLYDELEEGIEALKGKFTWEKRAENYGRVLDGALQIPHLQ